MTLQAARAANIKRVVYVASSACYGIPDSYPTPETAEIRPQYPYALTKWLGECEVMHWAQVYGLPALALRFFNIYGPRARTSGTYGAVFGVFLAQLLAGKPLTIVGDGEQTRDFTYVSDAVDALICAAESSKVGLCLNVGSDNPVSVNYQAKLLGAPETVNIHKRPGEPDCTFGATGRIKAELGWTSKVPIEDGVQNMLKVIDYWRDAPVSNMTMLRADLAVAEALAHREVGERSRALAELVAIADAPADTMLFLHIAAVCELIQLHLDPGDLETARDVLGRTEALVEAESLGADVRGWLTRVGPVVALADGDAEAAQRVADQVDDPFWGGVSAARI